MKTKFLTHKMRVILFSLLTVFVFIVFFIILGLKLSSPFKVSIYNYESYLDRKIIANLKKNYSYHTFTNLDEFTRAIKNKKAVAGVGSDYQIAQLILDNKLKKINFKKLFNNSNFDDNEILNLYPKIVKENFSAFENWIINKIIEKNPTNFGYQEWKNNKKIVSPFIYYSETNNVIGFEIDGEEGIDRFYQFLIPYFILDKMIVYNTDNSALDTSNRSNLKDNVNFNDIDEKETWFEIISSLKNKYKKTRVYWTNWFQDNAMIGQFYAHETLNINQQNSNKWIELNKQNYKKVIDWFFEFVLMATGKSIKNPEFNKLATDGQELVSSIIEPINGKADISVMYNGDAMDAYYGNDNFEKLGNKPHIDFKRPKHSYVNIDAWIISKETDNYQADHFLKILGENLFYKGFASENEIENEYLKNVLTLIKNENKNENINFDEMKQLFLNGDTLNKKMFYKKYFTFFKNAFTNSNLPFIQNFNTINYTPASKSTNDFLKKWYFLNENLEQDLKAIKIFDLEFENNGKTKYRIYQPLELELKTLIIDYYYETTKS
ncbi:hypothetical protein [Metamycoplasma equirhinis]|uniref:hypothetical protein n=1 Tax=Metamycoplasma equirhinis TaxID=92402 RepID=UPI003593B407